MVAGRLSGDAVVRRLGPARVIRFGGVLALLGLGAALAVPGRWVVDAGFILVGAGLANVVPVVFSAGGRLGRHGGGRDGLGDRLRGAAGGAAADRQRRRRGRAAAGA